MQYKSTKRHLQHLLCPLYNTVAYVYKYFMAYFIFRKDQNVKSRNSLIEILLFLLN